MTEISIVDKDMSIDTIQELKQLLDDFFSSDFSVVVEKNRVFMTDLNGK